MSSRMSTGSTRLSLAAIADKLLVEKKADKLFLKNSAEFIHTARLWEFQNNHPQVIGKAFEVGDGYVIVDNGILEC